MDNIKTFEVACEGGLVTNLDVLQHGKLAPGSAIQLINLEPNDGGGYRRVLGYDKYDTNTVPGTGNINGLGIIGSAVVACRDNDVYVSHGGGWTKINTDVRNTAPWYRVLRYNFIGTEVICFVDGTNKPFKYDGSTYTVLTNAPGGATAAAVYSNHLFFGADNQLTFAAPATDNDFNAANGAGLINVGDTIVGLQVWRDQLIIFCQNRILKLTGKTSADFTLASITANIGCTNADSIQELGGDIIFLAPDGLRTLGATDRIGDYNLGSISDPVKSVLSDLTRTSERICSAVIRSKSQYRLLGYRPNSSSIDQTSLLAGYITRGDSTAIEFSQLRGFRAFVADSAYDDAGNEVILFANNDGYVYRMEKGYSFDGVDISSTYQTPYYSLDDANVRKVFYKLHLYLQVNGAYNMTSQLLLDYKNKGVVQPSSDDLGSDQGSVFQYGSPAAVYGTAIYGGDVTPVATVPLVGAGMAGSFVFTTTGIMPVFAIKSLSMEYGIGGRR